MLGSASPRNPSVAISSRSAHVVDLAGGVPLERQLQLLGRDAVAVVRHPDQAQAAPLDVDPHIRRAGIERRYRPAP